MGASLAPDVPTMVAHFYSSLSLSLSLSLSRPLSHSFSPSHFFFDCVKGECVSWIIVTLLSDCRQLTWSHMAAKKTSTVFS